MALSPAARARTGQRSVVRAVQVRQQCDSTGPLQAVMGPLPLPLQPLPAASTAAAPLQAAAQALKPICAAV